MIKERELLIGCSKQKVADIREAMKLIENDLDLLELEQGEFSLDSIHKIRSAFDKIDVNTSIVKRHIRDINWPRGERRDSYGCLVENTKN
jgi:hypothetical protein